MKLSEEQINDHLSRAGGWRLEGNEIARGLKFDDFNGAIEFVNQVAGVAEEMDHHPDIFIHGWNNVRLSVTTHDEGGLTERDFRLAERINALI
ncbi:MAG: 4a-hydroxytetrahydrobiopterin dehydratase [Blastocatellia bacterium]